MRWLAGAFHDPHQPLFGVEKGQLQLGELRFRPAARRQRAGELLLDHAATELDLPQTPCKILCGPCLVGRRCLAGRRGRQPGVRGSDHRRGLAVECRNAVPQRLPRLIGQQHELPQPQAAHAGPHGEQIPGQITPGDADTAGEVIAHGQHQHEFTGPQAELPRRIGGEDQRQQESRVERPRSSQQAGQEQRHGRHRDAQELRELPVGAAGVDDDQCADEADRDGVQCHGRQRPTDQPAGHRARDQPGHQRGQRRTGGLAAADRARVGSVEPVDEYTPA